MTEMPAVEVLNLTKSYGGLLAVDHVNLKVDKGEIFGLLGPNGAGKTTTIRMLTGLTRPTSGTALVEGYDSVKECLEVKQRIGVVSEASNLYNEMSAWDNLMFVAELYGVDRNTRKSRTKQLLEAFQLYDRRNDHLITYSKGMKRRVRIAAALIHNPDVLFLDEPTSGLDVQSSRLIRSFLRELNGQGTTVFLTTHYIDEADQLCDRVTIIKQGRIVVEGSPEELKSTLEEKHVIEFAFNRNASDVEKLLRENLAFKDASKKGDKYSIRTVDPSTAINKIVQFATSNGLEILSLNTRHPSLEDVFIKYTGLDAVQVERMEFLRAVKGGGQRD